MSDKKGVVLERLRELIDSSGKTRDEIAKAIECDTSTITKHYNGNRQVAPEFIIKYAQFFGVSSDYLLGLSNAESTDKDIQFISKYTGLSDEAIEVLHFYKNFEKICPTINRLLESEMTILHELAYQCSDMPKDMIEDECVRHGVDFVELNKTIELKEYNRLQIVTKLEKYLELDQQKYNKLMYFSESGNVISTAETDPEYIKDVEDLFSLCYFQQYELIEKVLTDNIIEALKQLKKGD